MQPGTLVTLNKLNTVAGLYESFGDDGILRYKQALEAAFIGSEVAIVIAINHAGAVEVRKKAYILCQSGMGWVYADALVTCD